MVVKSGDLPWIQDLHPRNVLYIPKMAIFKRTHLFQGPSFWLSSRSFSWVYVSERLHSGYDSCDGIPGYFELGELDANDISIPKATS